MQHTAHTSFEEKCETASAYSDVMRKHYRAHMAGTNINQNTLLTTDYLNHYNDVVMILEMLPIAPEDFILPLLSWEPKTYARHFEGSGSCEGDLAVRGYEHAPKKARERFDFFVDELTREAVGALTNIQQLAEDGRINAICRECEARVVAMRRLIAEAAAVVNDNEVSD